MKLTKTEFKGTLLRNQNMKIDLADMKAHQDIIGDNTFKKAIRKEERKKKFKCIAHPQSVHLGRHARCIQKSPYWKNVKGRFCLKQIR